MSEAKEEENWAKPGTGADAGEQLAKSASAGKSSSDITNAENASGSEAAGGEDTDSATPQTDNIQDQMLQLKAERDKYKDIALRSVADLDNYRKRMAREKDEAIRFAN